MAIGNGRHVSILGGSRGYPSTSRREWRRSKHVWREKRDSELPQRRRQETWKLGWD